MQAQRLNFRCSPALREKLEEAAKRSNVSLSEQARVTLERVYGVVKPEPWFPEILSGEQPSSKRPGHEKKLVNG